MGPSTCVVHARISGARLVLLDGTYLEGWDWDTYSLFLVVAVYNSLKSLPAILGRLLIHVQDFEATTSSLVRLMPVSSI